jgi:hypothetical protein
LFSKEEKTFAFGIHGTAATFATPPTPPALRASSERRSRGALKREFETTSNRCQWVRKTFSIKLKLITEVEEAVVKRQEKRKRKLRKVRKFHQGNFCVLSEVQDWRQSLVDAEGGKVYNGGFLVPLVEHSLAINYQCDSSSHGFTNCHNNSRYL